MNGVPANITLNPLAAAVIEVLEQYTVFPWPVLSTQCKRFALDPANLSVADLERLAPLLAQGVARFTTPAHESAVKSKLAALVTRFR